MTDGLFFARWGWGLVCGAAALFIVVSNAITLIQNLRGLRPVRSGIPLLGGAFGCVALLTIPVAALHSYWWVPWLADWGSVPGLAAGVFQRLRPHRH